MQPPFRPRVCSLQPVLHPTDEMDETMYDETTTTIYDTFSDEVGGELAAIGDSSGHARGDMLQVRQDEHMRDEMRSEMDSEMTLADTAMTSAGAQDPSAPSQDSQDSQECVVPPPPPAPPGQHPTPARRCLSRRTPRRRLSRRIPSRGTSSSCRACGGRACRPRRMQRWIKRATPRATPRDGIDPLHDMSCSAATRAAFDCLF